MQRIVKSLLLFLGFIFHQNRKSKVLYYHDVGKAYTDMGTPLDTIIEQIRIVEEQGFKVVKEIRKPNEEVIIAFDDGWHGLYDERLFFIKKKIYPTVFIAIDLIGKEGYMSLDEIIELHNQGFNFQSHTWTHTGLPDHSQEELVHELKDSKNWIEEHLNKEVDSLCFPQGRFSKSVIEGCKKAGYTKIYSSLNGCYDTMDKWGIICRNLLQGVTPRQLALLLNGDSSIYRRRLFKLHYSN